MTIAIDADDMGALSKRLSAAGSEIADASPRMPGSGAFGPAVLAGAVASFESAMRRKVAGLSDRWAKLDAGVRDSLDDFAQVESSIIAKLGRVDGPSA